VAALHLRTCQWGGIARLLTAQRMDQEIFFLINHSWSRPWLDTVMACASSWDFWWPFLVLGGGLILIKGGFRGWVMLLVVGITIGVVDGLVVRSLKDAVGRPRPYQVLEGVRMLDLARVRPRVLALWQPLKSEYSDPGILIPHGKSFPSGHSANNFALATVVFLFYRRWGWLLYVSATIVAYSRIYVGSHWPLDVVCSAALGAGLALLIVAGFAAAWERFGGRILPRFYATYPVLLKP